MNNYQKNVVRTFVPVLVASVVAWLTKAEKHLTPSELAIAIPVASTIYYAIIRNGEGLIASVPNNDKYSFDWAVEMRDNWRSTACASPTRPTSSRCVPPISAVTHNSRPSAVNSAWRGR